MSSSIAAQGQVVIAACVLYAVLAMASLGVSIGTRANPGSQLRLQVNAWWLIFPVVSVCLVFYPAGPLALIVLIGALAIRELAPLHARPRRFVPACGAVLAATMAIALARPALLPALFLAALCALAACLHRQTREGLLLAAFTLMLAGVSFLAPLMQADQPLRWMFYLFVLTALNDVGQFIAGKTLGRQRIAPHISPNKTWQGLAGGVAVSIAVSTALGGYLGLAGLPVLAGIGAVLALGGFAGDLAYSAVKRRLGLKDFSQLIPGHGGILDRVDSLVATCPLLYFLIR